MIRAFIMWMVRRKLYYRNHKARSNWPVTIIQWKPNPDFNPAKRIQNEAEGIHHPVARRYAPFLNDEYSTRDGKLYSKLPWWAPFNALLHHWQAHEDDTMHDHARRSLTIVLKGEIIEKTPWGEKRLRAGSMVLRSTKYIHGFRVDPEHSCKTWTLFVVGRRIGVQNTYSVERRFEAPIRRGAK